MMSPGVTLLSRVLPFLIISASGKAHVTDTSNSNVLEIGNCTDKNPQHLGKGLTQCYRDEICVIYCYNTRYQSWMDELTEESMTKCPLEKVTLKKKTLTVSAITFNQTATAEPNSTTSSPTDSTIQSYYISVKKECRVPKRKCDIQIVNDTSHELALKASAGGLMTLKYSQIGDWGIHQEKITDKPEIVRLVKNTPGILKAEFICNGDHFIMSKEIFKESLITQKCSKSYWTGLCRYIHLKTTPFLIQVFLFIAHFLIWIWGVFLLTLVLSPIAIMFWALSSCWSKCGFMVCEKCGAFSLNPYHTCSLYDCLICGRCMISKDQMKAHMMSHAGRINSEAVSDAAESLMKGVLRDCLYKSTDFEITSTVEEQIKEIRLYERRLNLKSGDLNTPANRRRAATIIRRKVRAHTSSKIAELATLCAGVGRWSYYVLKGLCLLSGRVVLMHASLSTAILVLLIFNSTQAMVIRDQEVSTEKPDSIIQFASNSESFKVRICENQNKQLSCSDNHQIFINSAEFGRMESQPCSGYGFDGGATCSTSSTSRVSNTCNSQTTCLVRASKLLDGDPCPGTSKYLEISYSCMLFHDQGDSDAGSESESSNSFYIIELPPGNSKDSDNSDMSSSYLGEIIQLTHPAKLTTRNPTSLSLDFTDFPLNSKGSQIAISPTLEVSHQSERIQITTSADPELVFHSEPTLPSPRILLQSESQMSQELITDVPSSRIEFRVGRTKFGCSIDEEVHSQPLFDPRIQISYLVNSIHNFVITQNNFQHGEALPNNIHTLLGVILLNPTWITRQSSMSVCSAFFEYSRDACQNFHGDFTLNKGKTQMCMIVPEMLFYQVCENPCYEMMDRGDGVQVLTPIIFDSQSRSERSCDMPHDCEIYSWGHPETYNHVVLSFQIVPVVSLSWVEDEYPVPVIDDSSSQSYVYLGEVVELVGPTDVCPDCVDPITDEYYYLESDSESLKPSGNMGINEGVERRERAALHNKDLRQTSSGEFQKASGVIVLVSLGVFFLLMKNPIIGMVMISFSALFLMISPSSGLELDNFREVSTYDSLPTFHGMQIEQVVLENNQIEIISELQTLSGSSVAWKIKDSKGPHHSSLTVTINKSWREISLTPEYLTGEFQWTLKTAEMCDAVEESKTQELIQNCTKVVMERGSEVGKSGKIEFPSSVNLSDINYLSDSSGAQHTVISPKCSPACGSGWAWTSRRWRCTQALPSLNCNADSLVHVMQVSKITDKIDVCIAIGGHARCKIYERGSEVSDDDVDLLFEKFSELDQYSEDGLVAHLVSTDRYTMMDVCSLNQNCGGIGGKIQATQFSVKAFEVPSISSLCGADLGYIEQLLYSQDESAITLLNSRPLQVGSALNQRSQKAATHTYKCDGKKTKAISYRKKIQLSDFAFGNVKVRFNLTAEQVFPQHSRKSGHLTLATLKSCVGLTGQAGATCSLTLAGEVGNYELKCDETMIIMNPFVFLTQSTQTFNISVRSDQLNMKPKCTINGQNVVVSQIKLSSHFEILNHKAFTSSGSAHISERQPGTFVLPWIGEIKSQLAKIAIIVGSIVGAIVVVYICLQFWILIRQLTLSRRVLLKDYAKEGMMKGEKWEDLVLLNKKDDDFDSERLKQEVEKEIQLEKLREKKERRVIIEE